jgi:hypothetical protein
MVSDWRTALILVLGGLVALLVRVAYRLHNDAVQAQRERADDNRARAEAAEKRADIREDQLAMFRVAAVKKPEDDR